MKRSEAFDTVRHARLLLETLEMALGGFSETDVRRISVRELLKLEAFLQNPHEWEKE